MKKDLIQEAYDWGFSNQIAKKYTDVRRNMYSKNRLK